MVSLLAETRRQLNDYSTHHANNQYLLLTVAWSAGPANYNKMKLVAMDKYLDFWNLVSVNSSQSLCLPSMFTHV
jgi:chitinase